MNIFTRKKLFVTHIVNIATVADQFINKTK